MTLERLKEIVALRLKKYEGVKRGMAEFDIEEIKRINLENAEHCLEHCKKYKVDSIGSGTDMVYCREKDHEFKFMVNAPRHEGPMVASNSEMNELFR